MNDIKHKLFWYRFSRKQSYKLVLISSIFSVNLWREHGITVSLKFDIIQHFLYGFKLHPFNYILWWLYDSLYFFGEFFLSNVPWKSHDFDSPFLFGDCPPKIKEVFFRGKNVQFINGTIINFFCFQLRSHWMGRLCTW